MRAGTVHLAISLAALTLLVCGHQRAHGEESGHGGMVLEPDGGDLIWVFADSPHELGTGGELRIYVDAETHPEAGGAFAKYTLAPGGELPVHRHDETEEIAYFLGGEGVVWRMEGEEAVETPVSEGYVWYNPPGTWHALRNTGDEPLSLVFATIPNEEKGLLSFFRRAGAPPGETPIPIPPEEFARIAAEHDLILRPPGPAPDRQE